jgi:hypothetical protein
MDRMMSALVVLQATLDSIRRDAKRKMRDADDDGDDVDVGVQVRGVCCVKDAYSSSGVAH